MRKNTVARLVGLAVVAMLLSPAGAYAFGGKGKCDEGKDGHPFRIPPQIAQQYDSDADGTLSEQEREKARAAILEQYDSNDDGKLSRSERRAVHTALREAFMAKYDTDGDGEISDAERDAIKADFIARHDSDGDGSLSKDELPDSRPGGHFGRGERGSRRGPRE